MHLCSNDCCHILIKIIPAILKIGKDTRDFFNANDIVFSFQDDKISIRMILFSENQTNNYSI